MPNLKENEYITWCNDYCFDCEKAIKTDDLEHKDHKKLTDNNPWMAEKIAADRDVHQNS